MAFKWYTAPDGSVHGEHDGSAVEFEIEAPKKRGGRTTGFFFSHNSPTYYRFLMGHDAIRGTAKQIKKRADEEMEKVVEAERADPTPMPRRKSGGIGKAIFLGSAIALGGLVAWNWNKGK